MKKITLILLLLLAPLQVYAQKPILPEDFFVESLGKLADTTEILELSTNTFEVKQTASPESGMAQPLNFMSFCIGAALAKERGYDGWSMSMQKAKKPSNSVRYLTIKLLHKEEEMQTLPTTSAWTEYASYKLARPSCSKLIRPAYLWPDS